MLKLEVRSLSVMILLFVVSPMIFSAISGCSYLGLGSAEDDGDEEFAEFDADKSEEKPAAGTEVTAQSSPEGELELKLKVGDQFPLKKRIYQRLTQSEGQAISVNQSLLEMMLSLHVDEIRDNKRLLTVRYHRIRYEHEIAGKKVEYTSDSLDRVPTEALAYAGLKENFFSFWVGPNNRVTELVGFSQFLQRCLRDVPAQYRDFVMRQLETTHSEEGLANFIDDGIGLLPYSDDPHHPAVAVKVGSTWDLAPRRSEGQIPMSIQTKCELKNLTDTSAEIGLTGSITGPATPIFINEGNRGMRVQVKNGNCNGTCLIDRRTGLPTQSEVNRFLEMSIRLQDGMEITQRKEIMTSITSFLDQSPQQISSANMRSQREPESNTVSTASTNANDWSSNRVTQAVGTASGLDRNGGPHSSGRGEFDRNGKR